MRDGQGDRVDLRPSKYVPFVEVPLLPFGVCGELRFERAVLRLVLPIRLNAYTELGDE